jgi:diguanylate cyclase (GGDEF)-like protein
MAAKRKSAPRLSIPESGEGVPSLVPASSPQSATILVVEDHASSRSGLQLLLRSAGYRVVAVADAEAALAAAGDQTFDLVLCDVNLGGSSGISLTRALRRHDRHAGVPIILMSADAKSRRQVAGLDSGADDYVAKPIDFDELLARIRSHLRRAEWELELRRRCTYDALTGVLGRAAVIDELVRELKRGNRSGRPVSVLLVDLDRFKAINDRHGHAVGDEALRSTAETLVRLVRSTDRVGRIGGDEFLVVLPETGEQEAAALRGRLAQSWSRMAPRPRGMDEPVLISIGFATAHAREPASALLRRVDRSMYEEKARRARAGVAPAPTER